MRQTRGIGLVERMPADLVHLAGQFARDGQVEGLLFLLGQLGGSPRTDAVREAGPRTHHDLRFGRVFADDGDGGPRDGQIVFRARIRAPVTGDVPLVPDLEMLHPAAEVFDHELHVTRPRGERLGRGGRRGQVVVPLPKLRQRTPGGTGVETVAEVERHHDLDAVRHQLRDGRVGFGVDLQHAFLLLHPMPVDRVVVVTDAQPT